MNIIHYSNSFVSIKENDTLIACDPWTGYGQENGWLSYPIYKNGAQLKLGSVFFFEEVNLHHF